MYTVLFVSGIACGVIYQICPWIRVFLRCEVSSTCIWLYFSRKCEGSDQESSLNHKPACLCDNLCCRMYNLCWVEIAHSSEPTAVRAIFRPVQLVSFQCQCSSMGRKHNNGDGLCLRHTSVGCFSVLTLRVLLVKPLAQTPSQRLSPKELILA